MFPRITKVQRGNKTYQYLKIVKNEWKNGKVIQKVVANFGNVEQASPNLRKLIKSLRRYRAELPKLIVGKGYFFALHLVIFLILTSLI